MEISYKTILKYLTPINAKDNTIIKKNLIKKYESFPENIKNILKNDMYIYGNQVYYNEYNISHWSSILFLISKKFILLNENEQITYIKKIKYDMTEYIKKNYNKFKNRKKFSKNYAIETIRSNNFNPLILELISFCFKINLMIINFENDEISCISIDEYFNPWVPTIFLSYNNKIWQPLLTNDNKIFNYENLKFIFNHEIKYFNKKYLEQNFSLIDNIFEIIDLDENKKELNEKKEENTNNTFIKKINLNKANLKKMKKNDLIKLINEFNMNIDIKQKKDNLINAILDQ